MTIKLSNNKAIREYQKENERFIIKRVREEAKKGKAYRPFLFACTTPLLNAIDRLEERKRIRFSKKLHGYVLKVVAK